MKPQDISGQVFNRLTVQLCVRRDRSHSYWKCKCQCGGEAVVTMNNLRRGLVGSCGCLNVELARQRSTIHGALSKLQYPSIYGIWNQMKNRCFNQNVKAWPDYGGRGITVCERWLKFENFLADMGPRPEGKTIDRIDNNGNYEPDNCRWATRTEQGRNKRGIHAVIVDGRQMPTSEACEFHNLPMSTVYTRINRGWPKHLWFVPKIRD